MIQILKTKVCIVGSGPAGTFASEFLVKNGIDVIILEEGNEFKNSNSDSFLDKTFVTENISFNYGFSKQIGGSSNLWSGRLSILENSDINYGNKEFKSWPIKYKELFQYYKLASCILNINFEEIWSSNKSIEKHIPNIFKDEIFGNFDFKKFLWQYPPFNCNDYLKQNHIKFNNFKLISNTKVLKLSQNSQDGRINYVEAKSKEHGFLKIESDFFILANGGIEVPRILLNSNSNSPLGIGNDHEMVGKCLMTHPKANIGLLSLRKSTIIKNRLFNEESQKTFIKYGLGNKESSNKLNHYLQFTPHFSKEFLNPLNYFSKKEKIFNEFFSEKLSFDNSIRNLKLFINNKYFLSNPYMLKARQFFIRAYIDQKPNLDNKVFLSNAKDKYGIPKVSINWNLDKADKYDFLKFFENFSNNISINKIGNVESNILKLEKWPLNGLHSHFIGTTRMGNNPLTSVVDHNCKVHNISNLFIAGPSVFPSGGYANPFLTISALSLRLSEYLTKLIMNNK